MPPAGRTFLRHFVWLLPVIWFAWWPAPGLAQYEKITQAFIVSPAKQEISLSPGNSLIRNLYVTNRLGYDADFAITVEDVSGSPTAGEVVKYYGTGLGPYSIRKYIMLADDQVRIADGETKVVPIMISLPVKLSPGGLYGAVFVTARPPTTDATAKISTRIGSLLFLRVKGEVIESGEINRFALDRGRLILSRVPPEFQVVFANTGNIYLNPYGLIEIKNWRGKVVDRLPLDPWFVFPDATRTRGLAWKNMPLGGYFTANLYLNYGYANSHSSVLTYRFVVLPGSLILFVLAGLAGLFLIYQLRRKFKQWQI